MVAFVSLAMKTDLNVNEINRMLSSIRTGVFEFFFLFNFQVEVWMNPV